MEMLDKAAVNYQIILTKTDKISAVELAKVINETNKIIKEHAAAHINLIATSSEKNRGIDELRAEIAGLIWLFNCPQITLNSKRKNVDAYASFRVLLKYRDCISQFNRFMYINRYLWKILNEQNNWTAHKQYRKC